MKKILFLLLCGVGNTSIAQINAPSKADSVQHDMLNNRIAISMPKKPRPPKRDDLDGVPFFGGHLALRDYHVLPGLLQVDLMGEGYNPNLPAISLQPRTGFRGQLNLIGAMFNDIFDYKKGSALEDLFFYYSIRATWNFVPKQKQKGGAQHHVEFGADFGAKYFVTKGIYAEVGVMTHPLAMSYAELANMPIEPVIYPDGERVNEIIFASFHMYVGAAPFARVGFFPFKNMSVDFTLGHNYNWAYVNNLGVVPAYNGGRISNELIDIDNKNVYLNGRPVSGNDYRLGGRMIGVGFTLYMP